MAYQIINFEEGELEELNALASLINATEAVYYQRGEGKVIGWRDPKDTFSQEYLQITRAAAQGVNKLLNDHNVDSRVQMIAFSAERYSAQRVGRRLSSTSLWHLDERQGQVRGFMALGNIADIEVLEGGNFDDREKLPIDEALLDSEINAAIERGEAHAKAISSRQMLIMDGPHPS